MINYGKVYSLYSGRFHTGHYIQATSLRQSPWRTLKQSYFQLSHYFFLGIVRLLLKDFCPVKFTLLLFNPPPLSRSDYIHAYWEYSVRCCSWCSHDAPQCTSHSHYSNLPTHIVFQAHSGPRRSGTQGKDQDPRATLPFLKLWWNYLLVINHKEDWLGTS